jgi:multisubunit Na+/H+ antiporter MnhG subunit
MKITAALILLGTLLGILIGLGLARFNELYRFETVSTRDGRKGFALVQRETMVLK